MSEENAREDKWYRCVPEPYRSAISCEEFYARLDVCCDQMRAEGNAISVGELDEYPESLGEAFEVFMNFPHAVADALKIEDDNELFAFLASFIELAFPEKDYPGISKVTESLGVSA